MTPRLGLTALFVPLAACLALCRAQVAAADDAITLQGAGATFPAPLYQRWFQEYGSANPNVRVNYQPVGSGAGIKQFTEGLVNFGASDAAMTDDQIAQVQGGALMLPMTAGSVVLAYNLPGGPTDLKLSRDAYA
jgi:phosphate transport system substrate-binding protein